MTNMSICNHFRIRDQNPYEQDAEEWIKSLETQFNIDMRSVPQWKELTKRMHVTSTDLNRRIQECKKRKALIAHKLFIESARLTPFELNDIFARTGKKWTQIELASKMKKKRKSEINIESEPTTVESNDELVMEEETGTMHPNSAITVYSPLHKELEIEEITHLPPHICKDTHLKFPSIKSDEDLSQLSYHSIELQFRPSSAEEWILLKNTTTVDAPAVLKITRADLNEQTLNIPVINTSSHFMHIRYHDVESRQYFKRAKIVPSTPQRLCPGLSLVLKFVFKLKDDTITFATELRFKVGFDVYTDTPVEALCIPLITDFMRERIIFVPPIVKIPPLYAWQFGINSKYPKALINVVIDDDFDYHLHIRKQSGDVIRSLLEGKNNVTSSSTSTFDAEDMTVPGVDTTEIKVRYFIKTITEEIVTCALDTFVLKRYFVSLLRTKKQRKRNVKIPIFFTKIEHSGSHNSYYDFEFVDPRSDSVIMTKTCRIFADVLPHPIQIDPPHMLVLTDLPVVHGYGKGFFIIRNTHKVYPAFVKISTTKQMRKLFRIIPMKTSIPTTSSVKFEVKYCTVDQLRQEEDYVHCVIKIYVSGFEAMYKKVPAFNYEIVAPCLIYYNDLTKKRTMLTDPTKWVI